ncbi:iodotyrosine deiodinase [Brachionichthys hirsutus]|uniref:iodotyrosine deiodinase n=1 Tax=Brachionichthys hirsutus TaxID=412623 RepID=UPI003605266E
MTTLTLLTPVLLVGLCLIIGFMLVKTRAAKSSKSSAVKTEGFGPSVDQEDSRTDPKTSTRVDEDCDYGDDAEGGDHPHVPHSQPRYPDDVMLKRSQHFYTLMNQRRTVRLISSDPVPREVIDNVIRTAGTAPSGAHTEPWTFVVVSDAMIKHEIRGIVEKEEMINYQQRMGDNWVKDLSAFRTNWIKKYLDDAPYLILIFRQTYGILPNGQKKQHYYSEISIAIASGMLLAALQNVGLVTVTSTPLNCGPQLRRLLKRPANEKLLMLLPVGYPAPDATVPDLKRKPLDDIVVHI